MPESNDDLLRRIGAGRSEPPLRPIAEQRLTQIRDQVLSLLRQSEEPGHVSAVEEFKVQGGLGCSCNVRDESAILVHYIGADDERATAHVSVWNSTNKLNPTGPPIIQRDYPIAETGKKQEEEQWILRRFIAEWIEKGKPPGRL